MIIRRPELLGAIGLIAYKAGSIGTFAYLTLFDGYVYTWWNWIVALPVNMFMGAVWPLYWGVLRWVT